ncbi:unnamed protein product, partial [marine sediment metagenome]
ISPMFFSQCRVVRSEGGRVPCDFNGLFHEPVLQADVPINKTIQ